MSRDKELRTRNVRKFNTTTTDYLLSLNPQSKEQPLLDQLGNIFDSLVNEMVTGLADKGLVHFVLRLITLFPVPSNKCYRGLSWKLAERTLARMQYLPQNI